MENLGHYSIILTTAKTCKHAKRMALELVTLNLAACVQIHKVCSIYHWEHGVHKSNEYRLLIKTVKVNYNEIENLIHELNDYENPQVIQLDLSCGSSKYLEWISTNSQREGLLLLQQQ